MKSSKKKITFFTLFSGAGGFALGFKKAGFRFLGASDIDSNAKHTHEKNWPREPFIEKDARKLSSADILKITKGIYPDVIIGGPPCQGFSQMGDKASSDPRNNLFESYVKIVQGLQPKCFLFENVKGFATMYRGRYLELVVNSFSKIGYDVYFKILDSADYGVPQRRERVFLFGTRLERPFYYPKSSFRKIGNLVPVNNIGAAIMDLAKNGQEVHNHIVLRHSEVVKRRYKLIPEGGKLPPPEELPVDIRRKNFGNTYVRLHREKVSPTMVPGNNAFPIHPTLDRSLTPREAARLQSFPDSFIFSGARRNQCILVGQAVPPLLAANLALAVKKHLGLLKSIKKGPCLKQAKYSSVNNNKVHSTIIMKSKPSKDSLTFIDLFSGAGGFTIGLENAGLYPLLCVDINKWAAKTHRNNMPVVPFIEGDVSKKETRLKIQQLIGGRKVNLIVGGPPCQGFSIFGKRRFINTKSFNPRKDPRNKLVFVFWDYVYLYKPDWVIMENVPGFASLDNGYFLKRLVKEIEQNGYTNHECRIVNVADYGAPQSRKRFLLIANRTGHVIPWPKRKYFKEPKEWQKPYRTVGEVIGDLASLESAHKHTCHESMKHSPVVEERYSYIEEGKKMDIKALPDRLKYGIMTKKPIKNFSHVYRRLHRDLPSLTLVPGHNAFPVHPWLNRLLTVREAARIQTFPDRYTFYGPSAQQCIQVGNAFPVLVAELLGINITKAVKNNWKHGKVSKLAMYSILEKSLMSCEEKIK
jgi:DNA (cytosine-5)-methyltransferase 1